MLDKIEDRQRTPGPPDLRGDQRAGSGQIDELEGYAARIPNFTFTCCVAAEDSTYPNKGYVTRYMTPEHLNNGIVDIYLCGPPPMVDAVRTYLSDQGITPANFYYEKFAGSGVVSEIGESHVKVVDSDEAFDARMALELGAPNWSIGRLTPDQLTEYRRLAEATGTHIKDGHFVDPAGFRDTNADFHLFPVEATGNATLVEAYRKLLVQEYMGHVLNPSVDLVGDITQDHIDIVAAYERDDIEALRALIVEHNEHAKATMRAGIEKSEVSADMIFPSRFADKVLLVTGSAQGLGEAVATRAAQEGGAVALVDRSEIVHEVSEKLAAEGAQTVSLIADLEQHGDCAAVMAKANERFGRIDILINNVGGTIWAKPYAHYQAGEIEAEIRRSLFPTLWCCHAVLPYFLEQGHGTIVNVSSVATRGVNRVPYAAAKGGVNALTASLALSTHQRVFGWSPPPPAGSTPRSDASRGPTAEKTEQEKDWYQAVVDQTIDSSLLHRYGTLDEEAAPILFLASDEASYITGTTTAGRRRRPRLNDSDHHQGRERQK